MPSAKNKRCKKGTRRNKKTGECDPVKKKPKSLKSASVERRKVKSASVERRKVKSASVGRKVEKRVSYETSKENILFLENLMERVLKIQAEKGKITDPFFEVNTEEEGNFILEYDDTAPTKKYKVIHYNLYPLLEGDPITDDEVIQTMDIFQQDFMWNDIFYYYPEDTSKIDFIETRVYFRN
jgi:hypothetical protein